MPNQIAIQDLYAEEFQYCWGCGPKNEEGIHIKSYPNGETCISKVVPDEKYTGGVPNNLFGGMTAVIFDCHGTASSAYFSHKAKSLPINEKTVIKRFITARLEIDFIKPVPMNKEITVISRLEELGERKAIVNMEMKLANEVYAKARMIAVRPKD